MCGIVGFITTEKALGAHARKRWFTNAIRAGAARGEHGTGMILVPHDNEGNADWVKIGATPDYLIDGKHGKERFANDWDMYRAVVGHNRYATQGKVSTDNAHPFVVGPITLVHNGTLHSTHGLPLPQHKLKDVDVDSHVIAHNLADHSVEDVVKELDGAFTLVWHDARDQSVNIIRNERRPLHLIALSYHDTILFASEAEMLWWLTKRSDFSHGDTMYQPEAGMHMKFMPGSKVPELKKLELYKPSWGGYGNFTRGATSTTSDSRSSFQYDDDDAAWMRRARRHVQPGKETRVRQAHFKDREVLNRRIPKTLRKLLKEEGLDPRDELLFAPMAAVPLGRHDLCIAAGRLPGLNGQMCHVYGMPREATKEAVQAKDWWLVAPVAVKQATGEKIVVARLVSRTVEVEKEESTTETTSQSTSPTTPPDSSTDTPDFKAEFTLPGNAVIDGPKGEPLSVDEWRLLVRCGCAYCGENITDEDAYEMQWDPWSDRPVCPVCVVDVLAHDPGNISIEDLENLDRDVPGIDDEEEDDNEALANWGI